MTNILIIGVGTATSYVLEILSKLDIKKFTLIDGDQVEKRNLEVQNYSNDDIGNYKVRSLEKKYGRHMELKIFTQYVQSIYELELLVELNDYDYIINGADQISLMIGLIEAKIKQKFNGILIEGGYGVLNQNIYMIDNIESALEIQRSLKEFSSGNKR
ncbi:ThiF family adenylyltransferase [Enterococcus saigonensis]|nr:ThiF family adenylyltransferase [Enterococcus saigonensis]